MKFVQLSEARVNFEQLFAEVEQGETLVIIRGDPSAKAAPQTDAEARQRWIVAMRDLKKGAGIASIDDLLKWCEEARRVDRLRWKAPKLWTDAARPRHNVNSRA